MKDSSHGNSLVLDLGTATTKLGWSHSTDPSHVFPTLVGRGRHKGAMKNLGLQDSYVGRKAQNLRGILSLHSPVSQGVVNDWDDLETLWNYANDLASSSDASSPEFNVLVSVPPLCPPEDWRKMGEILLESSNVAGIYLANKSVLSMYGGGRTTGVCVDSGEDMTYIVPCWEGSPLPDATLILKLGGKHITDKLLSLLSQGKYSFPDDTFLIWKKATKSVSRLCIASRFEVVREAKERYCKFFDGPFVPGKTKTELEEQVLRLPDGNIVVVGDEAYEATELMFKPELASKKYSGLHELLYDSVMRCDEKLRRRLMSNIMLTGGNTLIPGLDSRLERELNAMLGPKHDYDIKVVAQSGRENFTWNGGAHLCSLSSFQRLWLTAQDYQEGGSNAISLGDPKQLSVLSTAEKEEEKSSSPNADLNGASN